MPACFNEAGAGCPGMRECATALAAKDAVGFNEAGAGCPGMPSHRLVRTQVQAASMRPGQAAPECCAFACDSDPKARASMRPGQAAPECTVMLAGDERIVTLQ